MKDEKTESYLNTFLMRQSARAKAYKSKNDNEDSEIKLKKEKNSKII